MQEEVYSNYGFDESNNGRFPVIYVLAGSNNSQDIREKNLSKKRKNHDSLKDELKSRDYNFLLLSNFENAIIPVCKKIGIISASLLYEKPVGDSLNLYIDGAWGIKTLDFTRGILKDITGLEEDLINIYTGKDLDKRINLVNIADETAHWLLRKQFNSLRENPHRKEILFKELRKFF